MISVAAICDQCGKVERLSVRTVLAGIREVHKGNSFVLRIQGPECYCEACAVAKGLLVECPGEAHTNGFIDNCAVCAPRWGYVTPYKRATRES